MVPHNDSADRELQTAELRTRSDIRAACPHCGHQPDAPQTRVKTAPFFLLMGLARLVVAIGAALSLLAILVLVTRGGMRGFIDGQVWALFAVFVLSVGVLLLYEVRDLLRQHQASARVETGSPVTQGVVAPCDDLAGAIWRLIGTFGSFIWLPFQSERDRLLIDHLTYGEQRELLHRLAIVTLCVAATTITPVLIAFAFLSPVAVCVAATAIASNLFVLDWFKKRHKQWLYSTGYAREHPIPPPDE